MSRPSPDDLRTSDGEVVRRVDLDRAAGTPGKSHHADPSLAVYEGVDLARAALAGDQAATDEFHDLARLSLPGVTEHCEGYDVRLVMLEIEEEIAELEVRGTPVRRRVGVRAAFQALNEGGHNSTSIDAAQLVAWILSAEGRAALARRGVAMDPSPPRDRATVSIDTITLMQVLRMRERANELKDVPKILICKIALGWDSSTTPWTDSDRDSFCELSDADAMRIVVEMDRARATEECVAILNTDHVYADIAHGTAPA